MTERAPSRVFRYGDVDLDGTGRLTCRYSVDDDEFVESFELPGDGDFDTDAARAAARLVFLLAGISYYKTGAPPLIEGPESGLTDRERAFLLDYHLHGLAEFAHVGGHDLSGLRIEAPRRAPAPARASTTPGTPLIPFGGGIDSVVVVEETRRRHPDSALFVANTSATPFQPIEDTAAVAALPVLRVRRHLDPKVLESRKRGYLNGHVPVTGILSALAVLTAVTQGRDRVVMSNEHSASEPTGLVANGVPVNHQWSKSLAFEQGFREVLAESVEGVDYFSALRPYSELWVARRFAEMTGYHHAFRSCNKAFYVDESSRLPGWCGRCDKCCFIDLILAPYLSPGQLAGIFHGREPLADETLEGEFRSLLGEPGRSKPLECVGDEGECRTAVRLTAARPDRAAFPLVKRLAAHIDAAGLPVPEESQLLQRLGRHFLPAG